MIHAGTWHDFPMAIVDQVTVPAMNADEVVDALANTKSAEEMDAVDVYKIDIFCRTCRILKVSF